MIIDTTCPICNKSSSIEVDKDNYTQWQTGLHIQKAFPDMSPEIREMLITGICPKCWDELFKEEDEED